MATAKSSTPKWRRILLQLSARERRRLVALAATADVTIPEAAAGLRRLHVAVAAAARAGDPVARRILRQAGRATPARRRATGRAR